METISENLSERIREARAREPIQSTTATRVAIDLLDARITALEDAFLQLSDALGGHSRSRDATSATDTE
jgi:hypothetical protein